MSTPDFAAEQADFKRMLTWRSPDGRRLESVRVLVTGQRIKAYGRIIAAPGDGVEAFNASYDFVSNDDGTTRRLSANVLRESGTAHLSVSRDQQGMWLVETPEGTIRDAFGGALDVEFAFSPFFNALPIRRLGLAQPGATPGPVEVPVVYVFPETVRVAAHVLSYTAIPGGVAVSSPITTADLTVDAEGFVVDYPGLAARLS